MSQNQNCIVWNEAHMIFGALALITPADTLQRQTDGLVKLLTVIINGTVLIISNMKDTWKICSQMFP